ncbi:MAG: 6-carboxytetrahydropterin synthase QueD [Deltaproteobacteria bacterium]
MRLEAEFHFSAAHRLPFYDGPCFRMHGHNYRLIVSVEGKPDPKSGMILDFVELKRIVERSILEKCDHQTLNDFLENPTAELIAEWMWRLLRPELPGLCELRLWETPEYAVVYRGE